MSRIAWICSADSTADKKQLLCWIPTHADSWCFTILRNTAVTKHPRTFWSPSLARGALQSTLPRWNCSSFCLAVMFVCPEHLQQQHRVVGCRVRIARLISKTWTHKDSGDNETPSRYKLACASRTNIFSQFCLSCTDLKLTSWSTHVSWIRLQKVREVPDVVRSWSTTVRFSGLQSDQ